MKLRIRYAAMGAMALAALTGCQGHGHDVDPVSTDKAAPSLTLRIYTVPADRSQSIENAVGSALGGIDVKLFGGARASISSAGPGKLLVYAPRGTQDSIGDVIESLAKTTATREARVQVGVHFWVVDGESGAGEDDPALKDLAGSLASLRQTAGPLHFHLDQTAALVSNGDNESTLVTADGPYQRIFSFRVDAVDGSASKLQLSYVDAVGHGLGKLNTQINATFGQYIVLAQAPGACPQPSTNTSTTNCPDKPAMRLLVVRVDRLSPKA